MANTLITTDVVAKLALPALLNSWVFAALVHKDYSKEYKKVGEDVRIRKPITVTAIEFDGDLTGQWQNVTEEYITCSMDTILTVPLKATAKDLTLEVQDFNEQFVMPSCQALADAIDVKLAKLYKDIPYYGDCTGTTAIADITAIRKIMSDNKALQRNRYGVLSPLTFASLLNLSEFRDLEKTGETAVLREASLGRRFGYELFENQNIQTHVTHASITADPAGTAAIAVVGATSMVVSALGADGTIYKGTIFAIAGDTQKYVVTADAAISGAAATISFDPALKVATPLGTEVVTFKTTVTTSKENLFFHKNAFAMVSAPLEPPRGGAKGYNISQYGIALSVVESYEHNLFENRMTISILCGFKTLYPELAVRLYDAS